MFRPGFFWLGCALTTLACTEQLRAGVAPPPQAVQLGPWLMNPQAHEITVAWTTRAPLPGRVDFAPSGDPGSSFQTARDTLGVTDHRLVLSGLLASTRYSFTISADPLVHGSFTTAPDPAVDPSAQPFTVLVYGDNRTNGGDHALVVNAAFSQHAQLALHTGDMVVNAKDQLSWARWFEVERDLLATTPLIPTVGNHEITDQGVTYSRHFKDPGALAYHSIDYGNVHIQVLDSFEISAGADPHAGAVSEAQKQWAVADAKAVPADRHLWMLVHQGPHTHPVEMRAGHGGLPGVQDLIAMVRKVHPVEVVFAGHEHFYERGEIDGLSYFVIGGGGAPLEDPVKAAEGVKLAVKQLSFITVEVCGCHVTGKAHDILGHIFDSFTLNDCSTPCAVPRAGQTVAVSASDAGTAK